MHVRPAIVATVVITEGETRLIVSYLMSAVNMYYDY